MTRRQDLQMVRRAAGWGLTARGKAAAVQLLEQTVEDSGVPLSLRLDAVETMLKIDALELTAERMAAAAAAAEDMGAGVTVFVLPPNGTEAAGGGPPAAIGFEGSGGG